MDILGSRGLSYTDTGGADPFRVGPGFVLDTDRAWESFLFSTVRLAFPRYQIQKTDHTLGARFREGRPDLRLRATPDMTIVMPGGEVVIADAKYKGRQGAELSVTSPDIYEVMAFCRAARSKRGLLLYPSPSVSESSPSFPGQVSVVERIEMEGCTIIALSVEMRGLIREGGYGSFQSRLASSLAAYLA